MKISVSSYSFSKYLKEGKLTLTEAVAKAAELGFEGIEFTDLPGETAESRIKLAQLLCGRARECGIEIPAYCVSANLYHENEAKNEAELVRIFEKVDEAEALGAPIMRHDVTWSEKIGGRCVSFERQLPIIAENVRRITEYAKEKGIRTCTENHGFVAQDSHRMERLIGAVDNDNYGLLVDIGNFACADEASIYAVSRLAPYAIHVHAKDFRITRFGEDAGEGGFLSRACNTLSGKAVGEGDIPVRQCIEILKRAGYDGYVSIEYEGSEDCIEGIKKGFDNLKKII